MISFDQNYFEEHIIHRPTQFYIPTPMNDDLFNVVTRWLWNGATGGVIRGNARIGKSRAIEHISRQLETRGGQKIPAHSLTIPRRDIHTVASIMRNLAFKFGFKPKTSATADTMSNDVVHFLAECSQCNDPRQVVLFIDEFQRLTIHQLGVFVELHDKLTELGTNLTVFFVGNSNEGDVLLDKIEQPEHDHIRGRFFMEQYLHRGIRNHEDVNACLEEYDRMRYPDAQGPTITEYFLPEAYRSGWRLSKLSGVIWTVYSQNYQKRLKLNSWGMRYFSATVRTLLVDYLKTDENRDEDFLPDIIDAAIRASGLVPGLVEVIKDD